MSQRVAQLLTTLSCALISSAVFSQTNEMIVIDNPFFDERGGGEFGRSAALVGDRMLVGAPLARDASGVDAGAAYLFDALNGDLLHVLDGEAPGPAGLVGFAVAMNDQVSLVGGYGDDPAGVYESFAGAAYVFDNATGAILHKFTNPDDAGSTNFGYAVALSDTHALIGAPRSGAAGQAFLFDLESGMHLHSFMMPDEIDDASFGHAVAISDDRVVVAARMERQVGALFAFEIGSGDLSRTIPNPTPASYDNFGSEIVVDGNNLLIGACGDNNHAGGAAYLFDVKTGEQRAVFSHPEEADGFTCFGAGLGLNTDHAVVSASFGGGQGSGAYKSEVLVFALETGDLVERHNFENEEANGSPYGVSTALSSDRLGVAISLDDRQGSRAGSAYIVPLPTR